ncbi:MAG: ATP-binding protein [bacterium]|nr:ATP-binding protein [bacterium]
MPDRDVVGIDELMKLRSRVEVLRADLLTDLVPFLHEEDEVSFRRLPNSPSVPGKLSVATTCTAMIACAYGDALPHVYESPSRLLPLIDRIRTDAWDSSGLPKDNAFTAVLVLRALGVLKGKDWAPGDIGQTPLEPHDGDRFRGKSLEEIAQVLAEGAPGELRVTDYPPRTEIGYWLVHGADELGVTLGEESVEALAQWAQLELMRQTTFVASESHTKFDPISLAMSACLLRRIEKGHADSGMPDVLKEMDFLESRELEHAVLTFFNYQRESLMWDSYFPMFHYPDPESGANHCWAIEVLEAILAEFPNLISTRSVFSGLCKTVAWCEDHKLRYDHEDQVYFGWNAGGQELTLRRGMPEAWAVGVIHVFFSRLVEASSAAIAKLLVTKYAGSRLGIGHSDRRLWDNLLDSEIELLGNPESLKGTIESRILLPAMGAGPRELRPAKSALLFGPPGTAKTTIARATAQYLGWPMVELSPTHFLDRGLENIYERSRELFHDLMELENVVVLFDEIDALVQKRGYGDGVPRLDAVRQFLTTSMLPKLGRLRSLGRCIFFLATNHRQDFDEAITRPGRFDLLLHVAPPNWTEKTSRFEMFVPGVSPAAVSRVVDLLGEALTGEDDHIRSVLELSTFAEMQSFVEEFGPPNELVDELEAIGGAEIRSHARMWTKKYLALRQNVDEETQNPLWVEYRADREASRIQT